MIELNKVYNEPCIETLKRMDDDSIDCVVTSPPYFGLRKYTDSDLEIGREQTPTEYIGNLVEVFQEVYRVLKPTGTVWVNIGDTYNGNKTGNTNEKWKNVNTGDFKKEKWNGCKNKDLIGIPWMLAFALRDRCGFYLRQDIIWCMSGGAYVYVKSQKGVMPMMIKDMVRLDPKTIQLYDGEKWVNVLGYGESNDTGEKIEIVLRSGERIGCTENHKWVLSDGREVATKELKVGDILKTCTLPDECEHTPAYMTPDILWLIGLYVAEGSRSGQHCIQLSLNADEEPWVTRINDTIHYLGGTTTHYIYGNKLHISIHCHLFDAILKQYIGGHDSHNVHFNNIVWSMPNEWLKQIMNGYFDGDGHYDPKNNRIRLGFTRNYDLERDLRIMAARLNARITLKPSFSKKGNVRHPSFRGEWRWERINYRTEKEKSEIVEIRKSRARHFYDISVDSSSHLYSLASGVLTHNCKPNSMPESVTDRCVKSHEYIFLLTKSEKYYFDYKAIQEPAKTFENRPFGVVRQREFDYDTKQSREPEKYLISTGIKFGGNKYGDNDDNHFQTYSGKEWKPQMKNLHRDGQTVQGMHKKRAELGKDEMYAVRNKRDVWSVNTQPSSVEHIAMYPEKLIMPCILAGCPEGGIVYDCFLGSGTTALAVIHSLGNRKFIGSELSTKYAEIAHKRIEPELNQLTLF